MLGLIYCTGLPKKVTIKLSNNRFIVFKPTIDNRLIRQIKVSIKNYTIICWY